MGVLNDIQQNNRKKYTKWLSFLVIIIISVAGYSYYRIKNAKPEVYKTAKVSLRTIDETFSSDGKVLYKQQYELNFQTAGTLAALYKQEGESVKKGDIIATLDDRYLQINLDKANISLKNAQANLDAKLATKGQKSDINVLKEQLKSTQTSLDTNIKQGKVDIENAQNNVNALALSIQNAQSSSVSDLENAKTNLLLKQQDLSNAQNSLESITQTENLNIKNSVEKINSEIGIALLLLEKYLRDIDVIIGVSEQNKNINNDYELYLGGKLPQTKLTTEKNYTLAVAQFATFSDQWKNYDTKTDIQVPLNQLFSLIRGTNEVLSNTREMLKNSIATSTLPQTMIDSLIISIETNINALSAENQKLLTFNQALDTAKLALDTKASGQNNTLSSLKLQVEQAQTALEKIQQQSKTTLDDLNQKYTLALSSLQGAKTKLQNNIDLANAQINISKANLELKTSSFDSRELEPFYVAIQNAKKGVEEAQKKLDDAHIISPIDGILAKVTTSKVGTNISQNPSIPFATIINKDSLYIEAKIEESDIGNVSLKQKVKLTFNALENLELIGEVTFISDKAEVDNNGIVSYKTQISFQNTDPRVKEGFTTQLAFITHTVTNALSLPIEAITIKDELSQVTLLDKTTKTIKTGIADADFIEIKEGLVLGQEVRY